MADIEKVLYAGLQADFDALEEKDDEKLYFCTDTKALYKGSDLYTDAIRTVTTVPTTPAVDVIYHVTPMRGGDYLEYYNGTEWVVIRYAYTDSVDSSSTSEQIPTASAVYQAIQDAVNDATGGGDVVNSVTAGTDDATIVVTSGDDSSNVVVPGVVISPSYDADTRTITLPMSTGDDLVITLGKDIFLDPDGENRYNPETKEIILTLDDGTQIKIPVEDLVNIYDGGTTTTATVTVNSDNEIDVDVTISSADGNALSIDAENGGLLVDLSDYATIEYVDEKAQSLADDIAALEARVETVEDAIDVLNGDETTEGSVDYKIAAAVADIEAEVGSESTEIAELEDKVTQNTEDISDLEERVETLENAMWWGTF